MNLKRKILGSDENKMGFRLTPKKKSATSGWALGDENAMGTYVFNENKEFQMLNANRKLRLTNTNFSLWPCKVEPL